MKGDFINAATRWNAIFLRLKRFRKVFTCYDKLSSIFLSAVMLAMIFDAVLCEQALKEWASSENPERIDNLKIK